MTSRPAETRRTSLVRESMSFSAVGGSGRSGGELPGLQFSLDLIELVAQVLRALVAVLGIFGQRAADYTIFFSGRARRPVRV